MILLGITWTTSTTTTPTVRRTCGYLNSSWHPVKVTDQVQDDRPDICTDEEWNNFVQEMGMEKEPEYVYTNSTFTATCTSGAAW